ncbi:MAG: DUF5711 family protein [Pseudobutyrivibrio sp.]|nr:DUF5711 family protein [Pseudobutyrivibrio sp.]
MEEFKIVKLPTKEENKEEDVPVEKTDDNYQPPKKKHIFLFLIFLFVIIGVMVIRIITTYTDYEVVNKWDRKETSESSYCNFKNNLLKYSCDGVFYTTYAGNLIWNYTYDMTNPNMDICGDYVIVYDKKGNEIDLFNSSGFVKTITCTTPIIEAKVAKQGTMALLLQENGVSHIQLFDKSGTTLVSGEFHPENRGFPVSIALSSDATRLLMSVINVDQGELSTELVFYDFTNAGKEEQDNIIASYTYVGMLVPKIDYVDKDKVIAFGDSKIIIFNNNLKATMAKEIPVDNVKSVFYNDKYFGFVKEATAEDGSVVNELNVYNLFGFKWMSKEITDSYEQISILDNNEILLNDNGKIAIYNMQGFKKFEYDFGERIYTVLPGNTHKKYYLIEENKTEEIYIK